MKNGAAPWVCAIPSSPHATQAGRGKRACHLPAAFPSPLHLANGRQRLFSPDVTEDLPAIASRHRKMGTLRLRNAKRTPCHGDIAAYRFEDCLEPVQVLPPLTITRHGFLDNEAERCPRKPKQTFGEAVRLLMPPAFGRAVQPGQGTKGLSGTEGNVVILPFPG